MRSRVVFFVIAASLFGSAFGCGSGGPQFGLVTGTVVCDGEPCQLAQVRFIPDNSPGSSSFGVTDTNGKYTLNFSRDKRGALVGSHQVEIVSPPPLTGLEIEQYQAAGLPVPKYEALPDRYGKPGELTADVKGGRNKIDFTLTKK